MAMDERKQIFSITLDRQAAQLHDGVSPKLERYMAGAIEALLFVAAFGGSLRVRSDKDRIVVVQYPVDEYPKLATNGHVTPEVASALFNGAAKVTISPPQEPAPVLDPIALTRQLEEEATKARIAAEVAARQAEKEKRIEAKKKKDRDAYEARKAAGIYYPSELRNGKPPKWGRIMQAKGELAAEPDALREVPEEYRNLPLFEIPVSKSPLPLRLVHAVLKWDPGFTLGQLDAMPDKSLQKIPGIAKRHFPVIREAIAMAGARQ